MTKHRFMNDEDVLNFLENEGKDVKFINLLFPDILGELRGFGIPSYELDEAFKEGRGFDGSSIEGLVRVEESDLLVFPNAGTFRILPWQYEDCDSSRYRVGCLFCDILNPDGTHSFGDTRYVLKRTMEKMNKQGYSSFKVGPELEFFYFRDSQTPMVLDKGDYFSMGIGDPYEYLRKKTALGLLKMGITPEYGHHEVAPSQHEIDLRYTDALQMADATMLFRYVVKEFARREGIYATFMPKPLDGENGNGMHVHQSLWKDRENLFFDEKNAYHLSDIAQRYIAGLMMHIREITSVLNQWVNSFKRLVPGYEAPVYIAWGQRNRSALIRIPEYKPGKENAMRVELRSPDPGCNPYLAFSLMLAAGMLGIEKEYELSPPCEEDIYHLPPEERGKIGVQSLPGNLEEAIEITRSSELVKKTLGTHLFEKFIANKEKEIQNYRQEMGHKYDRRVSPFEIAHNLPRL
ncbi:MAG: glutamine synthetase [Thermoplasmata archaeon]|nr:MAG: glutamine synthetase [Thermoplasmata archaeon]